MAGSGSQDPLAGNLQLRPPLIAATASRDPRRRTRAGAGGTWRSTTRMPSAGTPSGCRLSSYWSDQNHGGLRPQGRDPPPVPPCRGHRLALRVPTTDALRCRPAHRVGDVAHRKDVRVGGCGRRHRSARRCRSAGRPWRRACRRRRGRCRRRASPDPSPLVSSTLTPASWAPLDLRAERKLHAVRGVSPRLLRHARRHGADAQPRRRFEQRTGRACAPRPHLGRSSHRPAPALRLADQFA